ncbi:MAG TPA: glycosyltransferase [Blastocatellia bacterium]|nr:glycosyltransferase [Blastocatellia bacterium]
MSDSEKPMNSRAWWDQYFAESWQANGGSAQTRHFMERLLAELSAPDKAYLRSRPLDVLDWGCAFGEGVEMLARQLPASRVAGLDFSAVALDQARRRFPEREFIFSESGDLSRSFDVIIASNCLEHFEEPLKVIEAQLPFCKNLYIALVPYDEWPLSEHHRARLTEASFPQRLGGFTRLYARQINVDPAHWHGKQLLVTYGSAAYAAERSGREVRAREQEKWNAYYTDLATVENDPAMESFGHDLAERVAALLPEGGRILEAGCGGGWQSLGLARSGRFQVTVMDFSLAALNYARRLFEREQQSAEFIYGDVFEPGAAEFDLVFNAGVLEHYTLDEQARFLRGMASRSRNLVMALVPNQSCYWYWLWRTQQASRDNWPYGKEMPMMDMSEAFEAAGLAFVGQAYMGEDWAEVFIENLSGIDRDLCDTILTLHRSALIPSPHKAYLLAALGSRAPLAGAAPQGWSRFPAQSMQQAEATAALADALALNIRGEREVSQLNIQVYQRDLRIIELTAQAAALAAESAAHAEEAQAKEANVETLTAQLAASRQAAQEKDQMAQGLAAQLGKEQALAAQLAEQEAALHKQSLAYADLERRLQQLTDEFAEKEQVAQARAAQLIEQEVVLTRQLAEQRRQTRTLSAELANQSESAQTLAAHLSEKENEAQRLAAGLAEKDQALRSLRQRLEKMNEQARRYATQLRDTSAELQRIKSTLGWRLLSLYGPIKYRYLLPIYRRLGLAPARGTARPLEPLESFTEPVSSQDKRLTEPWVEGTPAAVVTPPVDVKPGDAAHALMTAPGSLTDTAIASSAHDVICFPIIEWDFRFQRPQQLMARYAAAGHRVFYVSQQFRTSGAPYVITEKRANVFEVSLRGPALNVYTEALDERGRDALFASLDALRRDVGLAATAAFVQLPFWWPLVRQARERFAWPVIYDCMDFHAGFSTNRQEMLDAEDELLRAADLVIASSAFLEAEARKHTDKVLVVRNACDYDHFAIAERTPRARPVVGYYGAIADWFDADLVADLAAHRVDWDFVLVGSTFSGDVGRLEELPNVRLVGEKPYTEIPDWLATFDVAIIPFKRTPLTEATNPVKAYEMLAAGKPVVAVPIPEVRPLAPLVRLASTAEEFEREIKAALDERDPALRRQRQTWASEQTWERRFAALAPAVRRTFPKASIIIVTFNNLALNRLCVESLYARTEWPNFEVIIIDNASSDGTPDYLREAERELPDLRVILNDENLGFAKANNQGLRRATGELLVLLNNDTVVTRGWMTAMIRHLYAERVIGLIGPVTNAISNEARIEVGYESIGEMPGWAARYVREHDNDTFAIPMLAMFCVAMRREVFDKVGLLDERFGVGMFEDDDYCRRLESAGYQLCCTRDSFIHHWQRASFRLLGEDEYLRIYHENRNKYESKWQEAQPPVADGAPSPAPSSGGAERYRAQLKALLARIDNSRGAVIFLPSIGWNVHLFQRPHHLARTFAQYGYVAIFDSSNARDEVDGFKEVERNLFLFDGPPELLHEIPQPTLWAFTYNITRADDFPRGARIVYDWIDALDVFPYDRAMLERNHARGLREAAVVAAVTRQLHAEAIRLRPDAIYMPNGVEYDRFAKSEATIPDDPELAALLQSGKPLAGYYGALAEWFDYDLLDEVARRRTDWNFLLIGQALDESLSRHKLLERPNIRWVGPRPYESLPGYLRAFDVAMIPFAINPITLATSPLKLYEYMAAGKPVITTPMPECQQFTEVNIARHAQEFAPLLDSARAQGKDEALRKRLRAIAHGNTWAQRVEAAIAALEQNAGAPPADRSAQATSGRRSQP